MKNMRDPEIVNRSLKNTRGTISDKGIAGSEPTCPPFFGRKAHAPLAQNPVYPPKQFIRRNAMKAEVKAGRPDFQFG
ncbi:MAG: hypothetical protein NTX44_11605 [Ignavibacteriales bacterium]|nr:hypothetical protein [Ignavibacteriales bacterium]